MLQSHHFVEALRPQGPEDAPEVGGVVEPQGESVARLRYQGLEHVPGVGPTPGASEVVQEDRASQMLVGEGSPEAVDL